MSKILQRLSLRHQIGLVGVIGVVIMAIVAIVSVASIRFQEEKQLGLDGFAKAGAIISEINIDLLNARRHEKKTFFCAMTINTSVSTSNLCKMPIKLSISL